MNRKRLSKQFRILQMRNLSRWGITLKCILGKQVHRIRGVQTGARVMLKNQLWY